ncbi:hypothetical protein ATCC90586_009086 [Pythium insidiosum]|nr:hypothetical protein ATCC90586_009086 [Pythium insidiosum]
MTMEELSKVMGVLSPVKATKDEPKRPRLEAFADNLTNPARYWFKQLPPEVKSNWKEALNAFHKKYCTDYAPARLTYYRLTQKSDELATNYLYRLNAAAMKAGIAFRDGSMSSDLEEHIQQFFETLHDKTLQMQFRFTPFDSIDDLEKKLIQYETAQIRPAKKQQARRHSIRVCRSFIEEMVTLHAKNKAAEAQAESSN